MKHAPGRVRYWVLIGFLVLADLALAAVFLGWLWGQAAGLPDIASDAFGTAATPTLSIPLSSAIVSKLILTPTITQPPATPTAPPIPPLTLDGIFPPRDLTGLKLDPKRLRTIVATGDVIPARSTDGIIRARKDDFSYTITATKELLAAGDITVINLEAPLVQSCPPHDSGFKFCGRPGFVQALQVAGVDVVTLENNHIRNFGTEGVTETIKSLEAARLNWTVGETPAIVDVRGVKFGFLAFNGVGERFNRPTMVARIKSLRLQVDVLVAAMHWGAEYVALPEADPSLAPDNPVDIAHLVIDAGADLVIGNHPHWIQGVELYKEKLIAYAHGNFIFDQMWSEETRKGVVGVYTFYDRTLVRVEYFPTMIQNYGQPVLLQGKAAQDVLDKMQAASRSLVPKIH